MSATGSSADPLLSRGSLPLSRAFSAWERQGWACAAGLLVGWTTLVYSLIWTSIIVTASAFGILVDAIFGSGSNIGHFLIDDVQVGLGSVALSVLGGLRAPIYLIAGAALAQLIALAMLAAEPWILTLQGYRRMSRREAALIGPMLDSVCEAMGIDERPAIWVAEKHTVGAWTHLRTIVLHQAIGLHAENRMLDDDELRALLAHELHHWRCGDAIANRLAWACSLPVYIPYTFAKRAQEASPLLASIAWFFLWPSWALINLVVGPLAAAGSRAQEWKADAAAAAAGYRRGLRQLLEEQTAFEPPRSNWERVVYATHPPIELRLERLEDDPPSRWDTASRPEPPESRSLSLPGASTAPARTGPLTPSPADRPAREPFRPADFAMRQPQHVPEPSLPAGALIARLAPAAILAVAAVLIFQADPFGSSNSPDQRAVPGAKQRRNGVPVGYASDAAGAAAAAANYNQAFIATSADLSQAEQAMRAMAAPAAQGRLLQLVRSGYAGVVANVRAGNPGIRDLQLSVTARTLAERTVSVSASAATFEVASSLSLTIGASNRATVTKHFCSLYSYDLVRVVGDWKLADLRSEPAPPAGQCVPQGFTTVTLH